MTASLSDRLQSHYESLARTVRFVRLADAKAAPVLGLQLILVGTLATRSDRLWAIVSGCPFGIDNSLLVLLVAAYGVSMIAVIWMAARVYMPQNPYTGKSLIYFEDISSLKYTDFREQSMKMDAAAIEAQLLDQIHRISQVTSRKMHRVRWAFILTAPASFFWLLLLIWGSI